MAPVLNRFTIDATGSTSSSGTGLRTPRLRPNRPRSVMRFSACSSMSLV
jgi:hypothetical protein